MADQLTQKQQQVTDENVTATNGDPHPQQGSDRTQEQISDAYQAGTSDGILQHEEDIQKIPQNE